MLKKGDWMSIKSQIERGVYQKDIARELGVHSRTVRRALQRGGAPIGKRPKARGSKLDAYKGEVDKLLKDDVWNAVVIFRLLQEKGYCGGASILRDYIRPKRPLRKSRETVRFETSPGHQLQSDWGELWRDVAGKRTKIHFIVNTLGFSRRFHFWCTSTEDAEHTYEGVARSFEHFGGVTKEVLVDYVPRHIIHLMFPALLCCPVGATLIFPRGIARDRAHNDYNELSHASNDASSFQTRRRWSPAEELKEGSHERKASSLARSESSA